MIILRRTALQLLAAPFVVAATANAPSANATIATNNTGECGQLFRDESDEQFTISAAPFANGDIMTGDEAGMGFDDGMHAEI